MVAMRPSGCQLSTIFSAASGSYSLSAHSRISGVITPAGQTAFTRTLSAARSRASARVSPSCPALVDT